MKHIAIPSMSVRGGGRPYTAPGLGDRIHSCLLGYRYGRAHGEPVTLHLTADKMTRDKPESWREILALFPAGTVDVEPHPVESLSNAAWVEYLHARGIPAECYYYGDTYGMHRAEDRFPLDISAYLRESPRLEPVETFSAKSTAYATVHWKRDGNESDVRQVRRGKQESVEAQIRGQGMDIVRVGGDADDPLMSRSLAHVGAAMAGARAHFGVDSGPMHLASLYLPYNRLHVYAPNVQSHHVRRWAGNGAMVNKP